jgi:hypothetical protein
MRKLLLLVAIVAAVAAWSVASASATIHPLVCSERSSVNAAGTPAQTQDPPGITNEGTHGNTDPDPDHAVEAQPVLVANGAAFKTC